MSRHLLTSDSNTNLTCTGGIKIIAIGKLALDRVYK